MLSRLEKAAELTRRVLDSRWKKKQQVIIFDSPDGTGKTEIAKGLSKKTGIPYFRMGAQHEYWRQEGFKLALQYDQTYLSQFLTQTGHSAIIDRAWPSEWVYSQVYRRDTSWSLLGELDKQYAEMGAVVVIPLRRSYVGSRPDEVVAESDLPKIHEMYEDFRKWTRCRTISIYVDSFKDDLDSELDALIPELKRNPPIDLNKNFQNVILDGFWTDDGVRPPEPIRELELKNRI